MYDMHLFLSVQLSNWPHCPPWLSFSTGGRRYPYASYHGLADAYCQAGVSCPAWSLAGQDGRWASQPRHTAGGHINPCVSVSSTDERLLLWCCYICSLSNTSFFSAAHTQIRTPAVQRVYTFILPVKDGVRGDQRSGESVKCREHRVDWQEYRGSLNTLCMVCMQIAFHIVSKVRGSQWSPEYHLLSFFYMFCYCELKVWLNRFSDLIFYFCKKQKEVENRSGSNVENNKSRILLSSVFGEV